MLQSYIRQLLPLILLALFADTATADYPLKPVPFNKVEMTSDFWRPRLVTQRKTLVPFAFERTQPGVEHLKAARDFLAGKKVEGHRARRFIDSDLYKVMEGAAYLLQLRRDPELEAKLDELADIIAGAQEADGYLYPSHTTGVGKAKNMMGDAPYTFVVHSHELYNIGHLYEAAIAYYQATGKKKLLDVAEKSAQHINKVFFVGDPKYNNGKPIRQAPGHQELELALVKLHRVTGKPLYLDMARKFLEIRGVTYVPDGEGVMSPTYAQQHAPVTKQKEAVGHAVRATYLYSAMADVGILTGEPAYGKALDRIWGNITNTRMHITGGLGAVHGIEGFGPQYELPNADAFNETCAAVGNVLFNYRMFLMHKDARYLDVAEVALLNNVLAAVNLEGNRFFYVNPLEADGKHPFNHGTAGRAPWFGTACCPSNMARLLPQVPGMTYAHDDRDVYITFYAASQTEITLDGVKVKLQQRTAYPNDGEVSLVVTPAKQKQFRVLLRIPTWARERFVPGELYRYADSTAETVHLTVNGKAVPLKVDKGFVAIDRRWKAGDRVQLTLPMPVRTAEAGEEVVVSIAGQSHDAKADAKGDWSVKLKPLKAGGPHVLSIKGANAIELKNVLIGDVWIGSGQSNMAGGVRGYAKNDEVLAELAAGTYPQLRLCRGKGGAWQESNPKTNAGFSAILFAFGQRLQQDLDVPVGLILGAVGGTPSGRWLTDEMLASNEQTKAYKAANGGDLYKQHILPVAPYGIRGVLWDQGESGTAIKGLDQFTTMGALIGGWRDVWGQGEFPFLYVQKPSGGGCAWDKSNPTTRMANDFTALPATPQQGNAGGYRAHHVGIMQHPDTAMVTARDLGSGIHPRNKSGYGHRAALVARGFAYKQDVEIYGPIYASHKVEGDKVRVQFTHVGDGLATKHGDGLQGFAVAGKDGKYHWAQAVIDGDSVVVSSADVPKPVAVQYAWDKNSPWANLFNKDGLPALIFRAGE